MPHPKDADDLAAELAVALGSELSGLPAAMRETTIDTASELVELLPVTMVSRLAAVLAVQNAFRYADGFANRSTFLDRIEAAARQRTTTAQGQTSIPESFTRATPCPTEQVGTLPAAECAIGQTEEHDRHLVGEEMWCPGYELVSMGRRR